MTFKEQAIAALMEELVAHYRGDEYDHGFNDAIELFRALPDDETVLPEVIEAAGDLALRRSNRFTLDEVCAKLNIDPRRVRARARTTLTAQADEVETVECDIDHEIFASDLSNAPICRRWYWENGNQVGFKANYCPECGIRFS